MNPPEIADAIEEAAQTLHQLPPVTLRQCFCSWPDYIHSFFDYVGNEELFKTSRPKIKPSPAELRNLDRVLIWMTWLDKEISRIIWARASTGESWASIGKLAGIGCHKTTKAKAMAGILEIHHRIHNRQLQKKTMIRRRF